MSIHPSFRVALVLVLIAASAQAQSFTSGSTGADGALDLSTCTTSTCWVQLPESGVLNYTTIHVPHGKTLRFRPNRGNTPAILLAQGDVTIAGFVDVSFGQLPEGGPDMPGPGGFPGGAVGQRGFGPGGGSGTTAPCNGIWVGPLSLVPIVGGSGGGGCSGSDGGPGGGAVVIASSTRVTVSGYVRADGYYYGSSRLGSGGAIRIVANAVSVSGSLSASPTGASAGLIRLEATPPNLVFTGSSSPAATLSAIDDPRIQPAAPPVLSIVSIAGIAVPVYAARRPDTADMVLPTRLPDPISIVVTAQNVPLGTEVSVAFSGSPGATFTPGTLSGTLESSTATIQVTGLDRSSAVTYLLVSASFDIPTGLSAANPDGPDHVSRVRAEVAPGGAPRFTFHRRDGSAIETARVPDRILRAFGQERGPAR